MKNKFMKKTLAAALALTLVGGGLPTAIGGKNVFENAIVADAADVGDVLNFGDYLDGYYKNYDGSTIYIIGQEDDLNTIVKISEIDWENSRIHIQEFVNHLNQELWVNIPADRMYEYPTGIKIVSGEGTEESPYELELVYEGEPIVGYDTTVGVGTKWMIGDLINTNAYFSVPVRVLYTNAPIRNEIEYYTVQLYKKELSPPVQMKYSIAPTGDPDYTLPAWGFENITLGCTALQDLDGNKWTDDIVFTGDVAGVKGIEVTGGKGTKDEPFTIAPITANQPSLVSNSMTLGGAISMNFYIDLSNVPEAKRSLSYVVFDVNGKQQTAKFDPNKMNSKKTAYGFTCMLNSVSMADDVKATLYYYDSDGEEDCITYTSTAETYLNKFNSDDPEKLWNLIKGINDYGYYMQKYLSQAAASPWTLGVDHKAMSTAYTKAPTYQLNRDTYLSEMASLQKAVTTSSDIEKFNYALALDSDTSLIVKIKPKSTYKGSISVKVTDASGKTTTATPVKLSDGRYQITINNISAHKLADMYTVTVKTTNGTATFKASALTYAYEGIKSLNKGDEYNAMCALYEYYKVSKAYKG